MRAPTVRKIHRYAKGTVFPVKGMKGKFSSQAAGEKILQGFVRIREQAGENVKHGGIAEQQGSVKGAHGQTVRGCFKSGAVYAGVCRRHVRLLLMFVPTEFLGGRAKGRAVRICPCFPENAGRSVPSLNHMALIPC